MLHGGGVSYLGMLPTAQKLAERYYVVLVAYDGFNPSEPETEFVSPMDQIITTCSIKFATRRALRRCWIASSSKTSCRRCRFCESEEKRMKRNYIIAAFRETVAQQFPEQSVELNRLLEEKL